MFFDPVNVIRSDLSTVTIFLLMTTARESLASLHNIVNTSQFIFSLAFKYVIIKVILQEETFGKA